VGQDEQAALVSPLAPATDPDPGTARDAAPAASSCATLRRARAGEAADITALAVRSKRVWGYSDAFMALVEPGLAVSEADIQEQHVAVLEAGGRLLGYCRVADRGDHAELEDLFVDPSCIGRGHGRRLFGHARSVARGLGHARLEWDSDPFAEAFYLRLGAVRIGETESQAIPGRMLPRMRIDLEPAAAEGGSGSAGG
jgi:GNAT superfamily N-acetyltransferase